MIQEIASYEELCALEPEWSDLWRRSPGATPFHSPDWLLPWWTHLFQGGRMWAITVRDQGRLTGLATLFRYGAPGEPRRAAFIGSGVSDYLGFLTKDAETAQQIWSYIASARGEWEICDLQDIRGDSPMLSFPQLTLNVRRFVSSVCPVLRLPATMPSLESLLSPKFRHNLRNARNRLADLGANYETAEAEQDEEYVDTLIRLHTARWKSRGEPGVLSSPGVQAFLRAACSNFRRRGWLRFHGLRYHGNLCSVVCIFCALGCSYYYLGGFDDLLLRYSPGSVLTGFAIQRAIAERCVEFDFLRHGERYKYDWAATDRINTRILIRSASNRKSETSADAR